MRKAISSLVVLMLAFGAPLAAQSLQQQNDEILQELKAIRQLLEKLAGPLSGAPPPAAPAAAPSAAPAGDHATVSNIGFAIGKADAPLTMVEFTDLQCPFCRQFHLTAFEQLKKDYIDTGKVRYISRDFPLSSIHPLADAAAKAARCAADQGKFWEMRHSILLNNPTLVATSFDTFAQDLKLNMTTFKGCEADPAKFKAELQKDQADGNAAGIGGTPSFILAPTSTTTLDGIRIVGAQPYSVFDDAIKMLLAQIATK